MSSYTIQERTTGSPVADGAIVSGPLPVIGSTLLVRDNRYDECDGVWDSWKVIDVEHYLHNTGPDVLAARVVVVVEQVP